jgi:protein TonB
MFAPALDGFALPRLSPAGLAAVATLHGVVFYLLLQMELVRLPEPTPVLQVALIAPPAPLPPEPKIVPPKPKPVEKRPAPRPLPHTVPLVSLPVEAPVEALSAVPPPPEVPVALPPIAAPAPVAPPPSAPPTPPRFDAAYLDNPKPAYPPLSRRLGEEGRVVLRVMVSAEGLPTYVRLHASSGSARLDQAALEAVSRWRFVPARQGEASVAAAVLVPIVFSLQG